MSLWILIAMGLLCLSAVIFLIAWIVSVIEGFKAHVGWGLFNLIGTLCLFPIPQIVFSVAKLSERWPLLVMTLGCVLPAAVGLVMLFFEGVLLAE